MTHDIFDKEVEISEDLFLELNKVIESEICLDKEIPFTSIRHTISYSICLYSFALLSELIKHIDNNTLLKSIKNEELINFNKKSLDVLYYSFYSLSSAMAIKNYSFSMRIINTISQTISVTTALNQRDKKGEYPVFKSYKEAKKNKVFDLKQSCSESEYLERFLDYFSDIDKRSYLETPDFTEFDNLFHPWLYKYFLITDPHQKYVKFKYPISESSKKITYQDVDNVITKGYQNYSLNFSNVYLTNNFGDFYFDSISPVTGGYKFPLIYDPFENDGNYIYLVNNMELQCIHSIIDSINYLLYYFESIPNMSKTTLLFERYISLILDEYYDSNELSYNIEKEESEILERDNFNYLTRNKDNMVIKIILGRQKIDSNRDKDIINSYFSNYRKKFLNNNDVFIKGIKESKSNSEISSINLSIKYLNLFKSIENAYWYRSGDVIASSIPLGQCENRIDDLTDCDHKLIFIGGKSRGRDEGYLINIFFERKIMSFFNICNSLIIGDSVNAIREVKKLYEIIISNLYIIYKEFDFSESKKALDKIIPSLLIFADNSFVNSHYGIDTWRDVRKILAKIKTSDVDDAVDNLSDTELDKLSLSAFEQLLENNELSSSFYNEDEYLIENLIFDEIELKNVLRENEEVFSKYLNKIEKYKIHSKNSKKTEGEKLYEREKILIDSIKEAFPSFYNKILKTDVTKNLCWFSDGNAKCFYDVSKFMDSKISNIPTFLDFDRIVANHFASMPPFFNDKDIKDIELSLLILDCAMLIIQTLEMDLRIISNSKVNISSVLEIYNYMIKKDILKLKKSVS